MSLRSQLNLLFGRVRVSAWRLLLDTPQMYATTPMIRGVWGRALKHLDGELYESVFVGKTEHGHNLPRYIIRPAPYDPETAPALDWLLFNVDHRNEQVLWRVWDIACGMGLGKKRIPFRMREKRSLSPENSLLETNTWSLSEVKWPLSGDPTLTPCILRFEVPLRLIRRSQLIRSPEFSDLITALIRRIAGLAGMTRGERYRDLVRSVNTEANRTSANHWIGEKSNLVRWSAAQQKEIEFFGISGTITLPDGPGYLWPLLAAAQWCHIGKGTVYGMGQIHIEPVRQ